MNPVEAVVIGNNHALTDFGLLIALLFAAFIAGVVGWRLLLGMARQVSRAVRDV
jgi:hypothetical protein